MTDSEREAASAPAPNPKRLRRSTAGATAAPRSKRTASAERRRRRVVGAIARTVGLVASVGIISGTVWALGWMPLPHYEPERRGLGVAPPIGDQQLVCAGPLLQFGISTDANQVTAVGTPATAVAAEGAEPTRSSIGEGGPTVFVQATNGETAQLLAAAESTTHATGQTAGFTAANCIAPTSSQWLLAGNTETGHTTALDVLNPGGVQARVNFRVFSATGLAVPGLSEMVIEPGEHVSVSLAGVVPDATSVAVEVITTGSPVVAYIHETYTDTLTPRGAEIAESTTELGTTQTFPAVPIASRPQVAPEDPTTLGTAVRLLNPNDTEVVTSIQVLDSKGGVAYQAEVPVRANAVIDYPLGDVPNGNYTVQVDASAPIVSSVRVAPLDSSEFAWLAPAPALTDKALVAVPEGVEGESPRLAVSNPGTEVRQVTIGGERVTIPAGGIFETDVAPGTVELEGVAQLHAAVYYISSGNYSAFPVLPSLTEGDIITVYR